MDRTLTLKKYLFFFVAFAALVAQCASVVHCAVAYGWTNSGAMGYALALVTVLSTAALTVLSIVTEEKGLRTGVLVALGLFAVAEWLANYWVGAVIVQSHMPLAAATVLFANPAQAHTVAALLYSGAIPVTVFLMVLAIARFAQTLWLTEPEVNTFAERRLRQM